MQYPRFAVQPNAQLYAGLLPLVAGVCGLMFPRDRNVRGLGLLAGFAALLAAGEATPFFRVFFHLIPGLGWLRIHSRATVLVTFAFASAAGLFLSRMHDRRSRIQVVVVTVIAGLGGAGFCVLWPGFRPGAGTMAALRVGLAAMTGLLLVLWTVVAREVGVRRGVVAGAIALLTMFDLGLAMRDLKRDNREPESTEFERKLHASLAQQGLLGPGKAPPRVFLPGPVENAGMRTGWSSVQGYSALALGRVWRHMHQVLGLESPLAVSTFPSHDLAGFGPFPYRSMSLVIGVDPRTKQLVVNHNPDPRVYLAKSSRQVRDDAEATALMRQGHDFHTTALVEDPVDLPVQARLPQDLAIPDRASIDRFEPEQISVSVESAGPALLVLAEPWFPGWSARVNGKATPCVPANAWMRAVPVPAGKSQVELAFHSTYLASGAGLSLLALVIISLLLVGRRQPRPAQG
jgi:hypothetical protein